MANVSFLLPVYNGAQYLAQTMDSLLAQDFTDFDIVVIDDGSTDKSAQIIAEYDSKKIRYIHKKNGGLVSALNFGLDQLDCEYVARIDADDICFPDRLSRQLDFIDFTKSVAVSCKVQNIDQSGNILGVSEPEYDFHRKDAGFIPAREPYLPHPFLTARLDALQSLGGFRDAHLAEDSDLCWRLDQAARIAIQPVVLGQYRIHESSISAASNDMCRIQAFYSQLASLNAVRRAKDLPEIAYVQSMEVARTAAGSVESLVALLGEKLNTAEAKHLRTATAMKYLDLSNWRQIWVSEEDIKFARKALGRTKFSVENQLKIDQIFQAVEIRQPDLFKKKWYQRT